MKKKKLLILTDNYLPRRDGIVRFLVEVIPRLKNNFEISIFCPDGETSYDLNSLENDSLKNVNILKIPLSKRSVGDFTIPKFKPFKIFKEVSKADIIFSQTLGPIGATGLFFAQRLRKRTVSYIHSIDWELVSKVLSKSIFRKQSTNLAKFVTKFIYSRNTFLIVPSENIAELFTWATIKTPRVVINLGTDTGVFKPLDDSVREERRTKLGFSKNDVVIGYHGRIAKEKNIETLLRAFIKLRHKHKNVKLFIIGSGLKKLEKKLSNQEGVKYLRAIDNVEHFLPLMDIYCLPSLTETTSLSVLEAMSCQLPVVSTPVGFVMDYITPLKTGLFFKKKDSFALMNVFEELLAKPDLRKTLGKNARRMVIEKFNWDVTSKKLIDLFNNIELNLHEMSDDLSKIKK